jgi:hypothetical protein
VLGADERAALSRFRSRGRHPCPYPCLYRDPCPCCRHCSLRPRRPPRRQRPLFQSAGACTVVVGGLLPPSPTPHPASDSPKATSRQSTSAERLILPLLSGRRVNTVPETHNTFGGRAGRSRRGPRSLLILSRSNGVETIPRTGGRRRHPPPPAAATWQGRHRERDSPVVARPTPAALHLVRNGRSCKSAVCCPSATSRSCQSSRPGWRLSCSGPRRLVRGRGGRRDLRARGRPALGGCREARRGRRARLEPRPDRRR